jgi:hypothetical protein
MRALHICRFDSAGDLKGRSLTYDNVKRLVLAAGRFSIFEATETTKRAEIYTRLNHDPELVTDNTCPYPWIKVRLATAEERADTSRFLRD